MLPFFRVIADAILYARNNYMDGKRSLLEVLQKWVQLHYYSKDLRWEQEQLFITLSSSRVKKRCVTAQITAADVTKFGTIDRWWSKQHWWSYESTGVQLTSSLRTLYSLSFFLWFQSLLTLLPYLSRVDQDFDSKGLDVLSPRILLGSYSRPRLQEIAAAINRLRVLAMKWVGKTLRWEWKEDKHENGSWTWFQQWPTSAKIGLNLAEVQGK